ncbi:hypothetical protein [Streptomyces yangpuensis]|uniref:hypothetical protein n=1 Tax=Streptomyces yangpuensis TaxID=1648182 RepID=UPI003714FB39
MDANELVALRRKTAVTLQECWNSKGSIIAVLRTAVAEMGPGEEREAIAFGVVGAMHDAFEMTLGDAKRISQWHTLGGNLSDGDIEKRIGTLIPRREF